MDDGEISIHFAAGYDPDLLPGGEREGSAMLMVTRAERRMLLECLDALSPYDPIPELRIRAELRERIAALEPVDGVKVST